MLSADKAWYWSGSEWVSTLSADGRWRWDGIGWRPVDQDIAEVDAPAAGHKTVRGALVGGIGYALLVVLIGAVAAINDIATDGALVAGLGFALAVLQSVALVLLVTGRGWRRVMEGHQPNARLSLILSLLLTGIGLVGLFLGLFVVVAVSDPTALGINEFREAIVVALLFGGAGAAFVRLTWGSWGWVLRASAVPQLAAAILIAVAIIVGAGVVCLMTAYALFGTDDATDRADSLAFAGILAATLALPIIGLAGLLLRREFGRIATTAASIQWALSGVGLLLSVPILWLLWRAPKPRALESPDAYQPAPAYERFRPPSG
jgi:hypothetical protein